MNFTCLTLKKRILLRGLVSLMFFYVRKNKLFYQKLNFCQLSFYCLFYNYYLLVITYTLTIYYGFYNNSNFTKNKFFSYPVFWLSGHDYRIILPNICGQVDKHCTIFFLIMRVTNGFLAIFCRFSEYLPGFFGSCLV